MQAQLFDTPYQGNASNVKESHVWSPQDHLNGHIVVTGAKVDAVSISLLGYMRVWTLDDPENDPLQISSGSYKFLHQTAKIAEVVELTDAALGVPKAIVPFALTVPRWCSTNVEGVPDQCLKLPPTMSVGTVLHHSNQEEYAQPRIKYSLRAIIRSQGGQVVVVDKEITVVPRSEPAPPVNISDFPSEFIETTANSARFSFFGRPYRMTISMPEPSPIALKHPKDHIQGELEIHVNVRNPHEGESDVSLHGLSESLRNLKFSLQPVFRSKTYYSTKPFPQAPGQDMVKREGGLHLYDSILKLPEQHRDANSWQQQLSLPANGLDKGRTGLLEAWTTQFRFRVQVDRTMAATFCSARASRQYSIIGRVRVKGAQVQEFLLECPLQVYYSPSEGAAAVTAGEDPESDLHRLDSIPSEWSNEAFSFLMSEDSPPAYTER